jgi:superfamily I DNA and RNA helicase
MMEEVWGRTSSFSSPEMGGSFLLGHPLIVLILGIPTLTQHFKILFRNLIYTGLTRAKKLAALVGTRKALAMAVKNQDTSQRQTYLKELLQLGPGLTIT